MRKQREVELLAIGAGPSNLALGIALEDSGPAELARRSLLIERHADTTWQRGMLMPWTRSQVSFLKDLVTLRDPTSKFTFVNYLHSAGRLSDFINCGSFTPYRMEISGYLRWVADSLTKVKIEYGRQAVRVEPECDRRGALTGWLTTLADGGTIASRYLVIAAGRDPYVPTVFAGLPDDLVIHSTRFGSGTAAMRADYPYRIAVVGAGQSAAEMLWAAHQRFGAASLTMIMRSIGLANYSTSRFTNELYFPTFVDRFFGARSAAREQVLAQMHATNYSGLDARLLDSLYEQAYIERVTGRERMCFLTNTDVAGAAMDAGEVVLTVRDRLTRASQELRFDRVLLGTGFSKETPTMIAELVTKLGLDEVGVSRSYRLAGAGADAACYLQGVNEATHGIADSLLSVAAVRAGEIVGDIGRHRASHGPWQRRAAGDPACG
ncbi:MAG TPA: SidA/IucD/PvdA family monooxygenase [Streptosporangiaceae bacterium]|nr:SidA/IucD/PvdA family monooxygenase [Streptosporangiaceae bacterium]